MLGAPGVKFSVLSARWARCYRAIHWSRSVEQMSVLADESKKVASASELLAHFLNKFIHFLLLII